MPPIEDRRPEIGPACPGVHGQAGEDGTHDAAGLRWHLVTAGLGVLVAFVGGVLGGEAVGSGTGRTQGEVLAAIEMITLCLAGLALFVGGAVSAAVVTTGRSQCRCPADEE
jgi:hypothetical protein